MDWAGISEFSTFALASVRRNTAHLLREKRATLEAEAAQFAERTPRKE